MSDILTSLAKSVNSNSTHIKSLPTIMPMYRDNLKVVWKGNPEDDIGSPPLSKYMAEFDPSPIGPVASKLNWGTPLEKSFNSLARMICDMSNSMLILKQDNISLYKHMYKVEERLMKKLDAETYLEHNEERLKEEV